MAALKVEVKSREMIKPSSPTPRHLKTVQLSFIDQFAPPTYVSINFFYPKDPNYSSTITHEKLSTLLKKSLSDTLVRFYPLAGRIEGNTSIDCNDQGAVYNEAHVASRHDLSKLIEDPKLEDLRDLLPFELDKANAQGIVLGVQVNHFSCGGIAICVCVSHKIADGTAAVDFVTAWATATIAAANNNQNPPNFDLASHFPPRDLNGIFTPEVRLCKEKIVTRRLIFDKKKIDSLREQATIISSHESGEVVVVEDPTRVEVVSAFIWKRFMEATAAQAKPDLMSTRVFAAGHALNLRTRMTPPIPSNSFGNIFWFALTSMVIEGEAKYPDLVRKLRESIRKIDNNYIDTLRNGECLSELKKMSENSNTNNNVVMEVCSFTSWCRFPLYEVDFGWGKPIWVCSTTGPIKNVVQLLSTKCGEGIEAWISMLEDDIALLGHDDELFSLATL